jgi:DNA polymerase I
MRHHIFEPNDTYAIALLSKATAWNKQELVKTFLAPLQQRGVQAKDVIAFTLDYNDAGKAPAGHIKDYLAKLLPALDGLGVRHLYVTDSAYFKVLAGVSKAEPHLGYALPCKVKGFEHMTVVLGVNYQQLIYNPDLQVKVDLSLKTLADSIDGVYQAIGTGIIHDAWYPIGDEIGTALLALSQYPKLTCDIEAFSLDFWKAGIGTIAFAWNQHEGVAFTCDYEPLAEKSEAGEYGRFTPNREVRQMLLEFFCTYKGELTFHRASYDVKVIIFTLWMADLLDRQGLLEGLHTMCTERTHDTLVIAYLATNSCAGNVLGLKSLAHEFAGNWAVEEIKDIRRVPLQQLLQYNLVDALSTFYVREKYEPIMEADNQGELYRGLFKDSLKLIIQLELTGMPMSRKRIAEVRAQLESIRDAQVAVITGSPVTHQVNLLLRDATWQKDYEDRKGKAKNPDKILPKKREVFDTIEFNPNSDPQKRRLLYEVMQLPVIDKTDSGAPATGGETIEKLINHATDPAHKAVLQALIAYAGVEKILSTFIPAFEAGVCKDSSDTIWLHGCFNLGGTVSGRLSSSDPNLQNLPANVEVKVDGKKVHLGKLVKSCFIAPPGWLFVGADFNSLTS